MTTQHIVLAAAPQGTNGHRVFGQRARFVRADDGRAAQRFNRRQVADDGTPLRHACDAYGKRDGDSGRQAFRNGTNGQRHGGNEHVEGRFATQQSDGNRQQRQPADGPQQPPGEGVHLARQRRHHVGRCGYQVGNAPGFGGIARGDHQSAALPGDDGRARVGHVEPVGQQGIGR